MAERKTNIDDFKIRLGILGKEVLKFSHGYVNVQDKKVGTQYSTLFLLKT